MAPSPENDNAPKAPDKSDNNKSEKAGTSDNNKDNDKDEKTLSNLNDGELKALLDEAINYKNPKDREGKSKLFKDLLNQAEESERIARATSAGGSEEARHYNPSAARRHHGRHGAGADGGGCGGHHGGRRHHDRHRKPSSISENMMHGGSLDNLAKEELFLESTHSLVNKMKTVSARQREGDETSPMNSMLQQHATSCISTPAQKVDTPSDYLQYVDTACSLNEEENVDPFANSDDSDQDIDYSPESSSDTSDETEDGSTSQVILRNNNQDMKNEKKTKKRKRNVSAWKKIGAKIARNSGKEYVSSSVSKKVMKAREMKPPCKDTCKLQCSSKITEENRKKVFTNYWNLGDSQRQRDFLLSCMVHVQPKYQYHRNEFKRRDNNAFYLYIDGTRIRVCKYFFKSTLCISDRPIRTVVSKRNQIFEENTDTTVNWMNRFGKELETT